MLVSMLTSVAGVPAPDRRVARARLGRTSRDWEHLPWLHRESFREVELEHEDERGWRARVGLRSPRTR
jgi:hypothetical protein